MSRSRSNRFLLTVLTVKLGRKVVLSSMADGFTFSAIAIDLGGCTAFRKGIDWSFLMTLLPREFRPHLFSRLRAVKHFLEALL